METVSGGGNDGRGGQTLGRSLVVGRYFLGWEEI